MTGAAYRSYFADFVFPVASGPIQDGAVVVQGDRIVFVGTSDVAKDNLEYRDATPTHFGRAVILPGLVNVHSHLELTVMRGFLEDLPFRDWITRLTRAKYQQLTADDLEASALLGTAEALRTGVTTLADTGDSEAAFIALRRSGLRGIAYREVFGPDRTDADASLDGLKRKVDDMRQSATPLVRVGVSPHAPYTVSPDLFERTARYAISESLDVCIHAAESEAESLLLERGEGDFARGLRERGIKWATPGVGTIRYLDRLSVLDAAPLLVHCVRATEDDLDLIARSKSRIAHCPRSNAKLGHGIAPLRQMLARGISVGLGTDSVASNNRCDLLGEAAFGCLLHRAEETSFTKPSAAETLRLITLGGAEALGLSGQIGSLEPGKQADLAAIDLSHSHTTPVHDAEAAVLFSATSSDVVMTMVAGKELYRNGRLTTLEEDDLLQSANRALARMR
jgi:5-methylthioadenosine/S-adenosylhomocysteine deaminase